MGEMYKDQLPLWVQYVQALGPMLVAVVAAGAAGYFAWRQWRTARTRVALDLFNERFAIFEILDEINQAWGGAKKETDEWVTDYWQRMREATDRLRKFRLLFPAGIGTHIDGLIGAWHDFVTAKAEEEGISKPSQEWSDHVKNLRRLRDAVGEKNQAIRAEIEKFIRLDWKG